MEMSPKIAAILSLLACFAAMEGVVGQMRNTLPETLQSCYVNTTALNRANRQPMHITNLIAILRKIEDKPEGLQFRNMRVLSRTLVKRFQYDGFYFDPDKSEEFRFAPHPLESIKNTIIHDMIPSNADILPNNIIDNDERCALHWMLSHSLNATLRDDQEVERYQRQRSDDGGLRAKRQIGGRGYAPITNRPIETGTVYTDWGPISAGRVIAGIAAALEPFTIPVPFIFDGNNGGSGGNNPPNNPPGGGFGNGGGGFGNGGGGFNGNGGGVGGNQPINPQYYNPRQYLGRKKRQSGGTTFPNLQNLYAATLAGDVGQAAILNAQYERVQRELPPVGTWNDTICPREYILNALSDASSDPSHDHDTWSRITGAEIRGGMDGLILGSVASSLSQRGFTLSQVLEMYYSMDGIVGESNMRSCDRSSVYPSSINPQTLEQQSRSFAYLFNTKIQKIIVTEQNIGVFDSLVRTALGKMANFQSTISSDPPCARPRPTDGVQIPDSERVVTPMATVYAVLDHSGTYDELVAQQRFAAKLSFELGVSPRGSRLGIVDGRTGQVSISPNWTDNAPILACRVLRQPQVLVGTPNLVTVLRTLKTELVRIRDEQERRGEIVAPGNQIVVLIFVQGKKLDENQRNNILDMLEEYDEDLGDVQITYTSSKYQLQDFQNFMLEVDDSNFVPIQQSSGNLSDSTSVFLQEFLKRVPGNLKYGKCNGIRYPNQSRELAEGQNIFMTQRDIKYYEINPATFFSSVDLRLRFTSENGKVRVCMTRDSNQKQPLNVNPEENERRNIECRETSGTYVDPSTMRKDIEFVYTKPCPNRKRKGCDPIYLSIIPTEVPASGGQVGVDCVGNGCARPDEIKVTFTHYDMRCNSGASQLLITSSLLAAILLSFLHFRQSW